MGESIKQKKAPRLSRTAKYCLLSGGLALLVMLFVYLVHSNTLLFGSATVLRMDLYHQYGPLYAEMYDRIVNGYSLVYSWTSGLGGGFLGNLFNYCCSPFAVIILLFGHKNMPEAIAVMLLLKAVLSSVCFTYYINKSSGKPRRVSAAFGLLYAFCGFFVAYSWNIMWMDAMAVFPLVMLGVEKIVNDRKPLLFLLSLVYTMITNYYMAYMIILFSCVYFLYYHIANYDLAAKLDPEVRSAREMKRYLRRRRLAEEAAGADEPEENGFTFNTEAISPEKEPRVRANANFFKRLGNRRIVRGGLLFAGCGLLAFLISAFALLPVFYCLQTSSATGADFPKDLKTYFNLFDFAANHLPGLDTTIRSSGEIVLPNIYCGLVTILLLPFYFLSGRVRGKKKVCAAALIAFLMLGFMINIPNFIWHGMHFPNDLPYRYSFAYSFILLTLAYPALLYIADFNRKYFILVGGGMVGFAVLLSEIGSPNVKTLTITLTIVFSILYVIIAGLLTAKHYSRKSVENLLIFFIVLELCIADAPNFVMSQPKDSYVKDYDAYQSISETVEKDDETPFYRTELSKLLTRMDACWYGYRGVSTFSSMAYEHVARLMEQLGMFGNNINSYTYYPQTPIFNSIFSLRYIYDNSKMLSEGDLYTQVAANDTYTAYRYNYFLPLAFSVDRALSDWDTVSEDRFEAQNALMRKASGVGDILLPVDATSITGSNVTGVTLDVINQDANFYAYKETAGKEATVNIYLDVEEDGEYYIYAGSTKLNALKFTAEDFSYDYYGSSLQPMLIDVGYHKAGESIRVEYTIEDSADSASLTYAAARLDLAAFEKAYEKLVSNGTFNLTSFDETKLSGTIDVKNSNALFFTSIPYDRSWHVYLDGKELEFYNEAADSSKAGKVFMVCNALLGFEIEKGEHTVTFEYEPNGLKSGLLLSAAGIAILALILLVFFLRKKKRNAPAPAAPEAIDAGAPAADEAAPVPDNGETAPDNGETAPENRETAPDAPTAADAPAQERAPAPVLPPETDGEA